ncbi:MAG: RNA-binding transcriptional accessory protein [Negativicutes bacterium]|nr:RNA-binding transcriptional accessory protein [Negativicutes bacterium]
MQDISLILARELQIRPEQATAAIELLDAGNTLPFVARYRKEATGELDEDKLRSISERTGYLRNLAERKSEVLTQIESQGKLTDEIRFAIESAIQLQEVEDIYLPFRPRKRTRAQVAREKGLEPLAQKLREMTEGSPLEWAQEYLSEEFAILTPEEALAGARDIIAEEISETPELRSRLRRMLWQNGQVASTLAVSEEEAPVFLQYKDYAETISRIPPHRTLAVNRGEDRKALKVNVILSSEPAIAAMEQFARINATLAGQEVQAAIHDGYKRLLFPALEREVRSALTENAERHAIQIFGKNLRQLLLQSPLSGHTVIGLDPGYRTGCKVAVVDPTGKVLDYTTIFVTASENQKKQADHAITQLVKKHNISLAAIGNGTASWETEQFMAQCIQNNKLNLHYLIVNEAGASVYSASVLAKGELPDLDVTIRGAVSIARRIQDPLAELVKIDAKAIGVGQYQHDVNQKELAGSLDQIVESCVNFVGADLNTASAALLTHIAGIKANVAKSIITYREENGAFGKRKELLKVPRLGPAAFEQCAGFLRIVNGKDPLDNTPVHPESYKIAEALLKEAGFTLKDLAKRDKLVEITETLSAMNPKVEAEKLNAGEPTVRDIIGALVKPGRDPREDVPPPLTRQNILKLSDLQIGSVLTGTIQNVTDFGAFVDIGLKTKGLVHRSELSDKRFRHPLDVVAVGDIVEARVISIDEARNRIGLSLKKTSE